MSLRRVEDRLRVDERTADPWPRLEYVVTIGSLTAANPACADGWTFHHVLPRRYFFLAGHTLCMLVKYLIATTAHIKALEKTRIFPVLEKEAALTGHSQDRDAMTKMFGRRHSGYVVDTPPLDLLKLCGDMTQTGWADLEREICRMNSIDADAIASRCIAPRFGGFAGIAPQQRGDDPCDLPERTRPQSGNGGWWGHLQVLRQALEGIAPQLGSLPDNRKIDVTVSVDSQRLIVRHIQQLTRRFNRVLPFDAADWRFSSHQREWILHPNLPRGAVLGNPYPNVFRVYDPTDFVSGDPPIDTVRHQGLICKVYRP